MRGASPILLVCGLLCVESALFVAFAAHRLNARTYVAAHLGVTAAAAVGGLCGRPRCSGVITAHLVFWTVLGGPFGSAMAAMLLVPRQAREKFEEGAGWGPVSTDHRELTRVESLHSAVLDRRLRLGQAHLIRPLLDVMLDGTQREKLDGLGLISRRYTPALEPALMRAMADKDGAVRVLAATVMARQHDETITRSGALQPEDRVVPEGSLHRSRIEHGSLSNASASPDAEPLKRLA